MCDEFVMNLLSQFESLLTPKQTSIATVTGGRGNDVWIGQTIGKKTVVLKSDNSYTTGQKVYYNRLTGEVLGNAPDVEFREFGV